MVEKLAQASPPISSRKCRLTNGSFDRAKDIVIAAKGAGADAVKLQTYRADTITLDCDSEPFQIKGTVWAGQTLYNLYEKAFTPWEVASTTKRPSA